MENVSPHPKIIRTLIHEFIGARLHAKLELLKEDDVEKRQALVAQHEPVAWLNDAARRASQIQLATHTLKAIHPDARGSVVNLHKPICTDEALIGTHSLQDKTADVVGNAAALDVFKLLKLTHDGRSIITRLLDNDADLLAALSDDAVLAESLANSLLAVTVADDVASSHTLAKQLYFPVANGSYHLLAPLFPTALVQHWHKLRSDGDYFSEPGKAARAARKAGLTHPVGYVDYPNLAVQSFGGTKPQNISQLNSERGGKAFLLSSLPPTWDHTLVTPPKGESIFSGAFSDRPMLRVLTKDLRDFLAAAKANNQNNMEIRQYREDAITNIVDEFLAFIAELDTLTPGWSLQRSCNLPPAQQYLLDPYAERDAEQLAECEGWETTVAHSFGLWLNSAIRMDENPMGDAEQRIWKHLLLKHLNALAKDLKEMRNDD